MVKFTHTIPHFLSLKLQLKGVKSLWGQEEKIYQQGCVELQHTKQVKYTIFLIYNQCWFMLARRFCVYNVGLKVDTAREISWCQSHEAKKGQSNHQKQNVRQTTVCLLHEWTFSSFILPWVDLLLKGCGCCFECKQWRITHKKHFPCPLVSKLFIDWWLQVCM